MIIAVECDVLYVTQGVIDLSKPFSDCILIPKTGLSFLAQKKWTVSISDINRSVTMAM